VFVAEQADVEQVDVDVVLEGTALNGNDDGRTWLSATSSRSGGRSATASSRNDRWYYRDISAIS